MRTIGVDSVCDEHFFAAPGEAERLFDGGREIPANHVGSSEIVDIAITMPGGAWSIETFFCPPTIAPDFVLYGVVLGDRFIDFGDPIPAELFLEPRSFPSGIVVEPGQEFALRVENIGGCPRRFRGALGIEVV